MPTDIMAYSPIQWPDMHAHTDVHAQLAINHRPKNGLRTCCDHTRVGMCGVCGSGSDGVRPCLPAPGRWLAGLRLVGWSCAVLSWVCFRVCVRVFATGLFARVLSWVEIFGIAIFKQVCFTKY